MGRPSYSRPRVRDDNEFVESLFRTAKYRPEFPDKGLADLAAARAWAARLVGTTTGTGTVASATSVPSSAMRVTTPRFSPLAPTRISKLVSATRAAGQAPLVTGRPLQQ